MVCNVSILSVYQYPITVSASVYPSYSALTVTTRQPTGEIHMCPTVATVSDTVATVSYHNGFHHRPRDCTEACLPNTPRPPVPCWMGAVWTAVTRLGQRAAACHRQSSHHTHAPSLPASVHCACRSSRGGCGSGGVDSKARTCPIGAPRKYPQVALRDNLRKENTSEPFTPLYICYIYIYKTSTTTYIYIYSWLLRFYVLATSSYQDGYQLVTVHTHGNFRLLPH